ncbi:retinol dehydrogenase [Longibacter salinarum]|uniref:Retinol dehydrogenase n=1 Tax=Longibacter salinarum TaxID=1850348 RepID=A0A2A8CVG0_9BACT|nr:SDR family oxidoreductase [Longibacter salinarum]PEN12593.1 retinol dehydrogenase [Longibacter salinarum]
MKLKDLTGHVCIVTGANSGIGKATALGLATQGARVAMVCRSERRGAQAREEILAACGHDRVDLHLADLSLQSDVRALGERLDASYNRIDVLVNNAGVFMGERIETGDGMETTLAVNHLAPFLLTHILIDTMIDTARSHGEARIVNVGSEAHRGARIDFDDLHGESSYSGFRAYGQSKLANMLFTHELARRLHGTGVSANCVHPGVVSTNIWRGSDWLSRVARFFSWFYDSPETGAEGPLYLAASPDVNGVTGQYFNGTEKAKPAIAAFNEKTAARLWRKSRALTGMSVGNAKELL